MKEEELLSRNKDLVASFRHERGDDEPEEDKAHFFVESFCLRNAKGDYETLAVGRRRNLTSVILHGTLRPKPGCKPTAVTIEVPVNKWRMYRSREQQCCGICVHSANQQTYRLGKPSREYQSQIGELMECVSYAKKIQLFMVDVVGTEEEVEADNVFGLDFLLEMMTDSALDRGFIEQHGNELFELLKELHMDKNLRFMTELKGMRPKKVEKRAADPGQDCKVAASSTSKAKKSEAGSSSQGKREKSCGSSSSSGPSTSSSPPSSSVASATLKKKPSLPHNGLVQHGGGSSSSSPAVAVAQSRDEADGSGDKKKRRRKASQPTKEDASPFRMVAGSSAGENGSSGKLPASLAAAAQSSPLKVAPEKLKLSDALPRLMATLQGHVQALHGLFEADNPPTNEAIRGKMKALDNVLKSIDKEDFEPLQYLLTDTYGGEEFFLPFFDLYRLLKRCRYSCSGSARDAVAKIRKHLISRYTEPVLRDVWYMRNRGELAADVRAIKDGEKAVWKEEKRKRLEKQRVEEKEQRALEREQKREEKQRLRAAQDERRKAWEVAHQERKQQRLLAKANKAEAMEVVGGAEGGSGKRPADDEANSGSRKRSAVEGGGVGLADAALQLLANGHQNEDSTAATNASSPRTSTSAGSDVNEQNEDHMDTASDDEQQKKQNAPVTGKRCAAEAHTEQRPSKVLGECNGQKQERERAPVL